MAAMHLDPDIKYVKFYLARRLALRAARAKLQCQLGYAPASELVEAQADSYMSDPQTMINLIDELRSNQPPGIQAPLLVQGLAALLGCGSPPPRSSNAVNAQE